MSDHGERKKMRKNQKSSPCQIGYAPYDRWYGIVLTIAGNVSIKASFSAFPDYMKNILYFINSADKASNNIVFVCKAHYLNFLIKELGIDSNISGIATYKRTTFDKDEILNNHKSFMSSPKIRTYLLVLDSQTS